MRESIEAKKLPVQFEFDFGLQCMWLDGEHALECRDRRLFWMQEVLHKWSMDVEELESLVAAPRS